MSNEVVKAKSLEERVRDRLHEQIGDLITTDDLKGMVDRAVEQVFFQDRVKYDNWNRETDRKPPLIASLVQELLQEQVRAAVDAWLKEHSAEVVAQIETVIAKGVSAAVFDHLDRQMGSVFHRGVQNLMDRGIIERPAAY